MDEEFLDRRSACFWWIIILSVAGIVMINRRYNIVKSGRVLTIIVLTVFWIELIIFLKLVNFI